MEKNLYKELVENLENTTNAMSGKVIYLHSLGNEGLPAKLAVMSCITILQDYAKLEKVKKIYFAKEMIKSLKNIKQAVDKLTLDDVSGMYRVILFENMKFKAIEEIKGKLLDDIVKDGRQVNLTFDIEEAA